VEEMKYLLETFQKLQRFNMKSTGCETLDDKIIEAFGPWYMTPEENKEMDAFVLLHFMRMRNGTTH
jgi:hypothetical protein